MIAGLRSIGPIAVRTERASVRAFAAALGYASGFEGVPLTYPVVWLSLLMLPDVVPEGAVLVQESQSFDYRERLALDRSYMLDAVVDVLPGSPLRVSVRVTVSERAGTPLAEFTTGLRLIAAGDDCGL